MGSLGLLGFGRQIHLLLGSRTSSWRFIVLRNGVESTMLKDSKSLAKPLTLPPPAKTSGEEDVQSLVEVQLGHNNNGFQPCIR
jgi:hypothetical protein